MPTIISTDNKGQLELSSCASQFSFRLVLLLFSFLFGWKCSWMPLLC